MNKLCNWLITLGQKQTYSQLCLVHDIRASN